MIKKGLGKGLGALIESEETEKGAIKELKITEIEPNTDQPRRYFDDEKLMKPGSINKAARNSPAFDYNTGKRYF